VNEQTNEPAPEQPKKRMGWPKGRKRGPRKVKAEAKTAAVPTELEGLTAQECCNDCRQERCVITGMALCGHPFKGGLQSVLMNNPNVMQRYRRAKKILAHQKVDATRM